LKISRLLCHPVIIVLFLNVTKWQKKCFHKIFQHDSELINFSVFMPPKLKNVQIVLLWLWLSDILFTFFHFYTKILLTFFVSKSLLSFAIFNTKIRKFTYLLSFWDCWKKFVSNSNFDFLQCEEKHVKFFVYSGKLKFDFLFTLSFSQQLLDILTVQGSWKNWENILAYLTNWIIKCIKCPMRFEILLIYY